MNNPRGAASTLLVLLLISLQHSVNHQCRRAETTKLVIHATKNNTGHWTAKVATENAEWYGVSSADGVLGPDHWKIEVDHRYGGCHTKETFSTIITLPPPEPAPGYELFEGVGYYKFHTSPKVWYEAKVICEQEEAHLAIINSEREASVLKQIFGRYGNIDGSDWRDFAAIGFHDKLVEGEYITIFGEPLHTTGFMRWSTIGKQPDNWQGSDTNPGEDCGSIGKDGGLNDVGCNARIPFICEREL